MKKVLIIANLFHASPRIPGLVKYLRNFGWESIILTTPLGDNPESSFGPSLSVCNFADIIEVENPKPVTYPKGLYHLFREFKAYPDSEKNWIEPAYRKACEIIENNEIDVILSSSSPVSTHIIAHQLKEKYGIKWVVDLRDLWSQNHNYNYSKIRQKLDKNLEINTLKTADALVTVTPYWKNDLAKLHNGKKCFCVTNGFDPDRLNQEIELSGNFTITYTGNIYKNQDPKPFLEAVNELYGLGIIDKDFEVRFYGPYNKRLQYLINDWGLQDIVKQHGMIDREEVFKRQAESHLLLLFGWDDKEGNGWYPLKMFEYLSARRPILMTCWFNPNAITEMINRTNSGYHCSITKEIARLLIDLYDEYKSNGNIEYNGNIKEIKKYSYYETAIQYSELMDDVIK